jgi:6-methylpretetramide 4-monooxygenase / 4-hydroxy-6-methylpretetramide 12a-monooxygenase
MLNKKSTEVLVVGAGPVGLCAALLLAKRGLRVQIIDEHFRSTTRSYALALHPASLELLDQLGLAEQIIAAGRRLDTVALYSEGVRVGEVPCGQLRAKYPFLVVLPQAALEQTLETALRAAGVEVEWNERLRDLAADGEAVNARIEHLTKESVGYAYAHTEWVVDKEIGARAALVLGADGHASAVRRSLRLSFDEVGAAQYFAIFEFSSGAPLDEGCLLLGPRAAVAWPLANGRCRVSFEIDEAEAALAARDKSRLAVVAGYGTFSQLEPALLSRLLRERTPWLAGAVGEVAWSLAVRFEQRMARQWGRGRIWLLGDAAHLGLPIGVRSMNMGLLEARALGERIFSILRDGAGVETLAAFGNAWSGRWRSMNEAPRAVRAKSGAPEWAARHAAQLAATLPASDDHLAAALGLLGLELPGAAPEPAADALRR